MKFSKQEIDQIEDVVADVLSNTPIDVDASGVKTELRGEMKTIAESLGSIVTDVAKRIDSTTARIDDAASQFRDLRKEVEDALEVAKKANTNHTLDESKLRALADEVFRENAAAVKAANAVKNGTATAHNLPPLEPVDPFFVENEQSKKIERLLKRKAPRFAIHASGPSGSGKTYPFEQVFRKLGRRYIKISCMDGISKQEMLARQEVRTKTVNGQTVSVTEWLLGFVPFCMKHGIILLLDEVDLIQAEISKMLNGPIESRSLTIPSTGEVVVAHDDWLVCMTSNSLRDTTGGYAGYRMDTSLNNRCRFIAADYLPEKVEVEIISKVGLKKADAAVVVKLLNGLRACYESGKISAAPSTRIGVRVAQDMLGMDDYGKVVDEPLSMAEAWQLNLLDGMNAKESNEALQVLKQGI